MNRREFDRLLDEISDQLDRISDQLHRADAVDQKEPQDRPPPVVYYRRSKTVRTH